MSDELNEAIAAVSAEAEKELAGTPEEAPAAEPEKEAAPAEEETPAEEAAPETEPAPEEKAEPKEDEEDNTLNLTAEDLAAINEDPRLLRAYKSMQRGLTKKATSLAEERKQLEERAAIASWVQNDPEGAVRAIAAARGIKLAEDATKQEKADAKAEVADALEDEWVKAFGEEGKAAASILRPLIEKTADSMFQSRYKAEVEPLREQVEALNNAARERFTASTISEFSAKVVAEGGEWDQEISDKMAELVNRMEPKRDENGNIAVPMGDYLSDIYKIAAYDRSRDASAKEQLARIKRNKESVEPTTTVRPGKSEPTVIDGSMSEKEAVEAATAAAMRQMGVGT